MNNKGHFHLGFWGGLIVTVIASPVIAYQVARAGARKIKEKCKRKKK